MLLLKELQLKNFLSHENTKITFEENESLLLDGISGAGKTSIVEGIIWAFYGQGRSNNVSLVRSGADKARVILTVSKDGVLYKIDREIGGSGKHTVTVSELNPGQSKFTPVGVSGVKLLQSFIESKIVGASYALFVNSAATPQDNTENFVKQTAAKKKDILLEIIKASDYDAYYDKAKEAIRERKDKVALLEVEIWSKQSVLSSVKETADKLTQLQNEKDQFLRMVENLKENIVGKEKIVEENNKINAEIEKTTIEIGLLRRQESELSTKIDRITREISEINGRYSDESIKAINTELANLPLLEAQKTELVIKQKALAEWSGNKLRIMQSAPTNLINILTANSKALNDKIIRIMSGEVKICPTINKVCPYIQEERDKQITDISRELQANELKLKENKEQIKDYEAKILELGEQPVFLQSALNEVEREISLLSSKKELLNGYAQIKGSVVEKQVTINEYIIERNDIRDNKIKQMEELKKQLSFKFDPLVSAELQKMKEDLRSLEEKLSRIDVYINLSLEASKKYSQFEEDIKSTTSKISTITEEVHSLEFVKEAFGNNGVKAILIDFVLPQLEDKINDILGKVSDFRIKLETQKTGASGDTLLEGLFVTITNGQGEVFDLSNYSGGEKIKISAAISEGLASLQKVGFRLMDESVTGLDNSTIDSFVEVMLGIQERFKQIICISHIQAVKDIFPKQITIIKQNGVSYAK